jgi:hypothetical protein
LTNVQLGAFTRTDATKKQEKKKISIFCQEVFFFSFPVAFVAAEIYYHRQHAA